MCLVANLDRKEEKTALPSFVQQALESNSLSDDERYALKFCSAAMYGGGLDTVRADLKFLSINVVALKYSFQSLDDRLDENFFSHDDHPPRNSA